MSIMHKTLNSLILCAGCMWCMPAVEIPEELPSYSTKLVQRFEDDAAKARAKAEREVSKMRVELIDDLEKEQKKVTKRGKLEDALLIKSMIESLEEEQNDGAAGLFGTRRISEPRLRFVADKSMPLFPVGTCHGGFPIMESNDALEVFKGNGIFFDQQTDVDDVIFEVQLPKAAKKLNWDGSAAQNLTITITDKKGRVLGKGGPWGGGNRPLQFSVDFRPATEFVVTLSNDVSTWFYIKQLSFE